jgi:hypothetical protein
VIVTAIPAILDAGEKLVMVGSGVGGGLLPPPLPHPARPIVAPKLTPRQPIPALLATFPHLSQKKFIEGDG